jgi:Txe/YoeB family toxin of toxin-antitoxin system
MGSSLPGVGPLLFPALVWAAEGGPPPAGCKPEQLKYHLPGAWSRRIDDEHRLVSLVTDEEIVILAARCHY